MSRDDLYQVSHLYHQVNDSPNILLLATTLTCFDTQGLKDAITWHRSIAILGTWWTFCKNRETLAKITDLYGTLWPCRSDSTSNPSEGLTRYFSIMNNITLFKIYTVYYFLTKLLIWPCSERLCHLWHSASDVTTSSHIENGVKFNHNIALTDKHFVKKFVFLCLLSLFCVMFFTKKA